MPKYDENGMATPILLHVNNLREKYDLSEGYSKAKISSNLLHVYCELSYQLTKPPLC